MLQTGIYGTAKVALFSIFKNGFLDTYSALAVVLPPSLN